MCRMQGSICSSSSPKISLAHPLSLEKSHKCTQSDYCLWLRNSRTICIHMAYSCVLMWSCRSQNQILLSIGSSTVERSHIIVMSAETHSAKQGIWRPTSIFTPDKNHKKCARCSHSSAQSPTLKRHKTKHSYCDKEICIKLSKGRLNARHWVFKLHWVL